MKVSSCFINNFTGKDWHVNLVPGMGFGDQAFGRGFVIKFTWLTWCWHISVWFKNPVKK